MLADITESEDNMKQVKKKAHLSSYFQKRTSGKTISTATLLLTATAARSEWNDVKRCDCAE